jgi:hypothetical protein
MGIRPLNRKETTMTRKSSRWHQGPALVVSIVALFAALTGAAAALPGTQTVNSGDIKNENVKSIDLKDGAAVAGADVIDESLESVDVQDATLQSADVQDNTLTGNDVAADTLQANDLAPNSVTGSELLDNTVTTAKIVNGQVRGADLAGINQRNSSVVVPTGTSGIAIAQCAAGETMLSGGGFFTNVLQANKGLQASYAAGGNSWAAVGRNNTGADQTLHAQALCLGS